MSICISRLLKGKTKQEQDASIGYKIELGKKWEMGTLMTSCQENKQPDITINQSTLSRVLGGGGTSMILAIKDQITDILSKKYQAPLHLTANMSLLSLEDICSVSVPSWSYTGPQANEEKCKHYENTLHTSMFS